MEWHVRDCPLNAEILTFVQIIPSGKVRSCVRFKYEAQWPGWVISGDTYQRGRIIGSH